MCMMMQSNMASRRLFGSFNNMWSQTRKFSSEAGHHERVGAKGSRPDFVSARDSNDDITCALNSVGVKILMVIDFFFLGFFPSLLPAPLPRPLPATLQQKGYFFRLDECYRCPCYCLDGHY